MLARTMVALVLLGTAPVVAQQHQHDSAQADSQEGMHSGMAMGEGMMPMMTEHLMMRAMRFSVMNVLGHSDALSLTGAQRTSLTELQGGMPMIRNPERMRALGDNLSAAFDNDTPNVADITAAVEALNDMHAHMQVRHLVSAARVRAVLTPLQREKLMILPMHGAGSMQMMRGPGASEAMPSRDRDGH